jgi:recombination associated protein RdgC
MWFRNLQVYRLPAPYSLTPDELAGYLSHQMFTPASSNELLRQGWDAPRGAGLVHTVNRQMLIMLATEKKLLPASVINQVVKAKAAELEEAQGFAPGRKAMKELRERVADELLPRAFSVRTNTFCWIDPVNGFPVVDAASPSKADAVVKMLLKAVDKMPLESLRVQRSPVAVMTAWLETDEAPVGFTVDRDAELRATGESRAAVRYVKHTLEVDDTRRHIAAGKQCTRLAMTWDDKISFVLTESLAIKGIKPLDVLTENAGTRNDEERFDIDFNETELAMLAEIADLRRATPASAPRPTDDELWDQTIGERDTYHDWADKLADAIAAHFGKDIGEHSSEDPRDDLIARLRKQVDDANGRLSDFESRNGPGAAPQPVAAAQAVPIGAGDPEAFFVQLCEIQGFPSDGEMDAALRGAFYEGIRYCSVHTPVASPSPAAPKDAQGAVPEGWKLVPIAPTDAMMDRAEQCDDEYPRASWALIWSAMLTAAPQPTDTTKDAK